MIFNKVSVACYGSALFSEHVLLQLQIPDAGLSRLFICCACFTALSFSYSAASFVAGVVSIRLIFLSV